MHISLQDCAIAEGLRGGDESVFRDVVLRHHAAMVRSAVTFVPLRAIDEEVAQEAWVGVIKGSGRFEGRSTLCTWILRYLEGTLPPGLQSAADRHLAECPHCREYLEQMRRTISLAHGLSDDDLPSDVVEALTKAFADYQSGGPAAT